jgi:integrative and conjugative element protein (TIGR02256 family)
MMEGDTEAYYALAGTPVPQADLRLEAARSTARACRLHPRYTLLGARTVRVAGRYGEILEVECENDAIPTHPPVDIQYRERLGLWFGEDGPPQVLALRRSFPRVPHLNQTPEGLPRSLCLYFEAWDATRTTWTPQRFLERILWWLSDSAIGRLHRGDQPVERLFYAFQHQLFLDAEFTTLQSGVDKRIDITALTAPDAISSRFLGRLLDARAARTGTPVGFLAVELHGLVHGVSESYPVTLGELADQMASRGGDLLRALEEVIRAQAAGHPIPLQTENQPGLLLVGLTMRRDAQSAVERRDYQAFLFAGGIGKLGEALGWLTRDARKGFLYTPTLLAAGPQSDAWRSIEIDPIEVVESVSVNRIRGIADARDVNGDFLGVLAGVGALGGALMNLWARQAWGTWTLFDSDYIRPHNPIRHEARSDALGRDKVTVVQELANTVHAGRIAVTEAIPRALKDFTDFAVRQALSTATLLVDASTTLDLPRDLSFRDTAPRCASVFFTPRGNAAVLMLEDAQRSLRLDQIEAQYYRAVIRQDWGKKHLEGNLGEYWVGGGCRDLSAVISPETVQLHAALLSRPLRLATQQSQALLRIWQSDPNTGSVQALDVPLVPCSREERGGWTVLLDEDALQVAREIRRRHVPAETGGILLGAIDHHRRTIAIVDALPPPVDSVGTPVSFERGTQGLADVVNEASRRTAAIVGYVGEWHSHPPRASTNMSPEDVKQLLHLTVHLATDGDPAVMLIVGDGEESTLIVGEVMH